MSIYSLKFEDGRIDWCTAKDVLHLLKTYDDEFDLSLQEVEEIQEITEEESKAIMVRNTEFEEADNDMPEEISLYDLAIGSDFEIIASTEFE